MGGGGKSPSVPKPPEPKPTPEPERDPTSKRIRDARMSKLRGAGGHAGNILSKTPLGAASGVAGAAELLGGGSKNA